MKYCIFGGSFNPPHAGHLYLAQSALTSLRLDTVIWVPAADPPHKTRPATPFAHRLAMVKLAIAGTPGHEASDVEATLPTPSYSLNTIEALRARHRGNHQWHLLIGADNWAIFNTWHRWEEVLKTVTLVVFPRRGYSLAALPAGVVRLDLPEMDAESSALRKRLEAGQDHKGEGLLPEIRDYAVSHGLYGLSQTGAAS